MKISEYSLPIFAECPVCEGSGGRKVLSAKRPRRNVWIDCSRCKGLRKIATFIPLEELELQDPGRDLFAALRKWLEKNR